MPPRKKTAARPPALTNDEVAELRSRVSAGDKPRVIVRAASAAVPAGTRGNVIRMGNPKEGEFIVVRLGRDEVPFAPSELALSSRSKVATSVAKAAPAAKSTPSKAAPRKTATTATSAKKRPAQRSSRRGQQPLTVTLRFADGTWTVEAQRGARRLARRSALRPGAVKAFAEFVDEPVIRDAISDIVESGRVVIAERAEILRAELQAAEATLKEYEARRR